MDHSLVYASIIAACLNVDITNNVKINLVGEDGSQSEIMEITHHQEDKMSFLKNLANTITTTDEKESRPNEETRILLSPPDSPRNTKKIIFNEENLERIKIIDIKDYSPMLLDWKTHDGDWHYQHDTQKCELNYDVHSYVDAKDKNGDWYQAIIIHSDDDTIAVHFLGWERRWDEVIRERDRIAPLMSHTTHSRASNSSMHRIRLRHQEEENNDEVIAPVMYPEEDEEENDKEEEDENIRSNLIFPKSSEHIRIETNDDPDNSIPMDERCAICFCKKKDCVYDPCGHIACCSTCAKYTQQCPVCRTKVVKAIIFFK